MATRYFNWKLATVLVVAIGIFTVAAYALHRWQVNARALQALPLGKEAYARQDYDEAAIQIGKYIAVNMEDVEVLLMYADAQLKRRPLTSNNVQQAIAVYRSALRLDSRNREAARRLVEVYLWPSMGAPGEAELIARRYLETSDDVGIRRMLADALWQQRKANEAAAQLTTILTKHPDDILSYERMGALAEQYPHVVSQPAAAWFDDAVTRNPDAALAYIARADFLLRKNERDKALADLALAQQRDLSNTETRLRLVGTLRNANLLDQARTHLQALQAKDPKEPLLWQYWADVALRANVPEGMYTVAQAGLKALVAQPWDFMPVATELLIRSDHLEEAGDCIAKMRLKDIAPPATAFLEGLMADKRGQLREAVASWRKAIALGYRQPTTHMMLASALTRLGDTQSAIGELRALVTEAPNYVEGRLALAKLLAQIRDWPEVLAQARQVQQSVPGHAEATLLELQARMYALAADRNPTPEREKAWQDLQKRLAQMDQTGSGALPAKLLQAQLAILDGKLAEAATLLTDLESQNPSEMKVILLRAELDAAQGKKDEAKRRYQEAVTKFPQALEPVQGLAFFLERQNRREECETVIKDGLARIQEPRLRRDLGLLLAEFYRQWKEDAKLDQWLSDLAAQFPGDIQPRRLLLTRDTVLRDRRKAQSLVDEIKSLEGEGGWQWRYEQARLWNGAGADEFKTYYPQIVKLLQQNLLANPKDHASRLLLADTYEKANELPLAVTTYKEASDLLPTNVPILVRTIMALNKVRDYAEVRRRLDQASRLNLHDPDLDRLRLKEDLRQGKLGPAADALAKLVSQDPNDTTSSLSLAWVRIQEKKYDEAGKILDSLQARMPDAVPVTAVRIELCIQQGSPEEAIRLANRLVEKNPSAAAYGLRAKTYIALKQYDKALDDFGHVIALDPKKAESWAARAEFYRLMHRAAEGIPDVRQALALAPDDPAIQRLAALVLLSSGDLSLLAEAEEIVDKALAAFGRVSTTSTNDPRTREYTQLRLLKAQVLMLKGTGPGLEGARRVLGEVTKDQPKVAEAWQWLAQLELSQEDPAKALDVTLRGLAHNPENGPLLLLKARAEKVRTPAIAALTLRGLLDQNPKNIDILVELADAYARSGRTQQAVDLLGQKLPELEGLSRRRGEIAYAEALYANGQKDEARSRFETLIQAEPNDPTPTMTLAQELRRERRWTEMNQLVQRWVTTHPKDADVATTIARVLAATGDRQALAVAEDLLRTTLARNPQSMSALMLLSMLMQDAGRNEESARLNRQILARDPNSVIAMNNLAWTLCEAENRPEQYQEAVALAEKGLQIVPDYVDLLDTRGYAYYRLGDFEKAVADFVRCTELYPANSPSAATPRFHLAMAYAAMKHKTEAVEQLRIALNANQANVRSAKEQADNGRTTYAIKVLKEAVRLQEQMEPLKSSLGMPPDQSSGLSAQELADARTLLDQLRKGIF
jgi:tetratricopeptide (TPR) repeat protein